ncbi:MAG: hypothetical protein LBF51_08395 [Zoogloeaceae bacterium]|nr:hypothetical protein [Zoogloeaceae bacterium]
MTPTQSVAVRREETMSRRRAKNVRVQQGTPGFFALVLAASSLLAGACLADDLEPFVFQPDPAKPTSATHAPVCAFPGELKLPADFTVFAAGAYSGKKISFQIDQSGHEGTQIDVAVNHPGKPVVLMLGAYEPTIWNIGWSAETKILAVFVSGYHRQAVAGLEKSVPQLNSSYDNKGACGYFYVTIDNLSRLNPIARRMFGQPVDMVFPAEKGRVVVGDPLQAETRLVTSSQTTPESFHDKSAPIAGPAGLEDAVRKGLLRKATSADAETWADAVIQNSAQCDIPPVAGTGIPKPRAPSFHNAYVVLKSFTYPAGLYGGNSATFLIPKGTPKPGGNPGHSKILDFNTLRCQGPGCEAPACRDQNGK